MTSSVRRDKFVFAEELIATRVGPILVRASAAMQEQKGLAGACDLIEEVDTVDSDGELTLFIRHVVFSATRYASRTRGSQEWAWKTKFVRSGRRRYVTRFGNAIPRVLEGLRGLAILCRA